jgi:hypothetical protein
MTAEEEAAVIHFPFGHRFTLLFIAYVKHILVNVDMKAAQRLQFLEWINEQTCMVIQREMLEMIQPMSCTEMKMMHEAGSLDRKDDPAGSASFKVLTGEVFEDFLALNPSLLAAIMLSHKNWNRTPAAVSASNNEQRDTYPPAHQVGRDWEWGGKSFNPVRVY